MICRGKWAVLFAIIITGLFYCVVTHIFVAGVFIFALFYLSQRIPSPTLCRLETYILVKRMGKIRKRPAVKGVQGGT